MTWYNYNMTGHQHNNTTKTSSTARHITAHHITAPHRTTHHITTTRHSIEKYSTSHDSTAQHMTAQHSTAGKYYVSTPGASWLARHSLGAPACRPAPSAAARRAPPASGSPASHRPFSCPVSTGSEVKKNKEKEKEKEKEGI